MRRSRIVIGLTATALVLPWGALATSASAAGSAASNGVVVAEEPPTDPGSDMGGGDSAPDATPNVGLGPVLSGDGEFVAFESVAPLMAEDTNTQESKCTPDPSVGGGTISGKVPMNDIYRYKVKGGTLDRPSKANATGQTDPVTGTVGVPFEAQGFKIDGHTGACVPATNGSDPAISETGDAVAFVSGGNLAGRVVEDEEESHDVDITAEGAGTTDGLAIEPNVYTHAGSQTAWTSDDGGSAGRELPAISADGRYVALVGRSRSFQGVWVKDTTQPDVPAVRVARGLLFNPDISPDGNAIAWAVYGENQAVYVLENKSGKSWVDVDPATLTPELVSVSDTGRAADGPTDFPSLSKDGRYVAFQSMDKALDDDAIAGKAGGGPNKAYVHDRDTGETEMVSVVDADGGDQIINGQGLKPAITPDGRYVAFASDASVLQGLEEDTTDHATVAAEEEEETTFQQVYVRDTQEDVTLSVSGLTDTAGAFVYGNGVSSGSYGPSISDKGNLVAFESDAANLVAGDTNGDTDAFVRDMTSGVITRISLDEKGAQVDLSPDSDKPSSKASAKPTARKSPLKVTYAASDSRFPSLGLAEVRLYVKKPGEKSFSLRQSDVGAAIDGKFNVRTGGKNGVYRFKTVAVDGNDNVEDMPARAASTRLDSVAPTIKVFQVKPTVFDISSDKKATLVSRVSEKGSRTVVIKHDGVVVKRFATKRTPRGLAAQAWGGRNSAGRLVHNGRYMAVLKAKDLAGNTSRAKVVLRVTR